MELFRKILSVLRFVLNFFPVKLLFIHFKRNQLFLIFWVILFGFTNKMLFAKYGIAYLFLTPEYLGEISILSYSVLGFAYGGFVMAFNIYSYILVAPRFLFIASLSRPFYKFSLNNFIIPLTFIVFYTILSFKTQQEHEFKSAFEAIINLVGFYIGIFIFIALSLFFFFRANNKISELKKRGRPKTISTTIQNTNVKWYVKMLLSNKERVDWYISSFTEVARARDVSHYTKDQLKYILYKNHLNATIFEIAILITVVILSLFGSNDLFFIPAGASLMLLMTFILMLISAAYSWIGGWTIPVVILFVLSFNTITDKTEILDYGSAITGLDYSKNISSEEKQLSIKSSIILENWKKKQKAEKPKLVVLAVSGGGLRSATWTVNVLHTIKDSLQDLSPIHLIAGSSGGMIGAAYFREEEFIKKNNSSKDEALRVISQDALNSLAFYFATSDWLVRLNVNKSKQRKERGYIFEKQLENNLKGLDKPLAFYKEKEVNSEIPLMMFTPSIISTNQQLVISSSENDFLNNNQYFDANKIEGFDSVKLSSVLRMSSTFPYIMPIVTTPHPQKFNIMDAGLIDNFGIKVLMDYLTENKDWINKNTSGVVVVKIVDNDYGTTSTSYSPLKKLLLPMKFFYANFNLQDKNNDRLIYQLSHELDVLDVVEFNLGKSEEPLSLSWHLTSKEKQSIINAITNEENVNALTMLKKLLTNVK